MYTFIINPNARSGLGRKVWNELEEILKKQQVPYQAYFTKYQRHATQLVKELTSDQKEHTIIALGGDGTVNEIVNGISDLTKATLGYIPIGSSNDFARYFHLNVEPAQALEYILHPTGCAHMNIGVLEYQNKRKRFAVSCGIGFDAAVCHQAVISRVKKFLNKLHLGKLTYVTIAIDRVIHLSPCTTTITLDDKTTFTYRGTFFIAGMNHPYQGGGFKFCPKADPCDDTLDVMAAAGFPKTKGLLILPCAYKGLHTLFKGVYNFQCKKMVIEADRAWPVHTDGEPVFLQRRLTLSLEPDKLKVIIPAPSNS